MSLKKSGNVEKKFEHFELDGAATLFGKKELKPEEKKGIVIRPLKANAKILSVNDLYSNIDWQADGYLIWNSDISSLQKTGTSIPVYKVKYRPKPSE